LFLKFLEEKFKTINKIKIFIVFYIDDKLFIIEPSYMTIFKIIVNLEEVINEFILNMVLILL